MSEPEIIDCQAREEFVFQFPQKKVWLTFIFKIGRKQRDMGSEIRRTTPKDRQVAALRLADPRAEPCHEKLLLPAFSGAVSWRWCTSSLVIGIGPCNQLG